MAETGAETQKEGAFSWAMVFIIIIVTALLASFYAINEYATGTGALVKSANRNADRFEIVFRDFLQARFRAMSVAAETMLQSRVTVEAFAKGDREALVGRIEPFFETLHQDHGVVQLNFWKPPANLYYRAGESKVQGMDLSKYRKSIVAANERQQKILAVETGLGGLIGVRAVTPVNLDGKHVGVLEFVTDFNIPLERAAVTTGLKWGVGLVKEVSERSERPADIKHDAWKGNDVFFIYSDRETNEIVEKLDFNPRIKDYTLGKAGKRTVFVKTFPVSNFSGVPTIVIATLLDLTEPFDTALTEVATKTAILFAVISILSVFGYIKFGQMRAGLAGSLSRQTHELAERAAACEVAVTRLKDVDTVKRGFFTNLVTAVNDPLQAVAGQLQSIEPIAASMARGEGPSPEVLAVLHDRYGFVLAEASRLSRLVSDYRQLELFRQELVSGTGVPVAVADVVGAALAEDLAGFKRLPQLSIRSTVSAELPPVRADAALLRRAIAGLVSYAAQRGGQGKISISARHSPEKGMIDIVITGSAFTAAGAPDEALIDESRQFLSRVSANPAAMPNAAPLVAVVLSRIILEFYGGSLELPFKEAGFIARLPVSE